MKDVKSVVAQLMKEGAQVIKNVTIQNVNLKDMGKYNRASLTLDKSIPSMVDDGTGVYVEGESNVAFVSVFSIAAVLGSMEQTAFAKNLIINNSNILQLLLSFAKADLLVEKVVEGQEYVNPFSSNPTPVVVAHDSYYVHIIDITLGNTGIETINNIKSKFVSVMLDNAFSTATVNAVTESANAELPY